MSKLKEIKDNHQLALEYLKASLYTLFPKIFFENSKGDSKAIALTFSLPHDLDEFARSMIIKRYKEIIEENDVKVIEMVKSNAIDYLKSQKHFSEAKAVKHFQGSLVALCQICGYTSFLEKPLELLDSAKVKELKILKLSAESDSKNKMLTFTLEASAASSSYVLKENLKLLQTLKEKSYSHIAVSNNLFLEINHRMTWTSSGRELYFELFKALESLFFETYPLYIQPPLEGDQKSANYLDPDCFELSEPLLDVERQMESIIKKIHALNTILPHQLLVKDQEMLSTEILNLKKTTACKKKKTTLLTISSLDVYENEYELFQIKVDLKEKQLNISLQSIFNLFCLMLEGLPEKFLNCFEVEKISKNHISKILSPGNL